MLLHTLLSTQCCCYITLPHSLPSLCLGLTGHSHESTVLPLPRNTITTAIVSRVVRGRGNWPPALPPWCWLYDDVWCVTHVRVIRYELQSLRRYMWKRKKQSGSGQIADSTIQPPSGSGWTVKIPIWYIPSMVRIWEATKPRILNFSLDNKYQDFGCNQVASAQSGWCQVDITSPHQQQQEL